MNGQLLRFEVMADDTKQLQFSTGMTFEKWKAWWDYLKSTAARVVSKAHQILREWAGKPQSSPFLRGSTSPNTDVFKVRPDEAGTSRPVWHKQIVNCVCPFPG